MQVRAVREGNKRVEVKKNYLLNSHDSTVNVYVNCSSKYKVEIESKPFEDSIDLHSSVSSKGTSYLNLANSLNFNIILI